ncbi:uncharacterized protein PV09_00699 [Verruconis gallopava]|uniref:RWD domain-containing protein n=1 Tax=Verruconis gallopava TaxID=253628 RepID=A0A0D1Y0Z9_9PEZI|nr:uncharacterized protein PV09_00699 [Verruconis gallopava]KIW08761.1 hypothetical protein PV09_00699 [Verruconis gallopava]
MEPHSNESGLHNEIALVQAMYPDETSYDIKSSRLNFKHLKGEIELRLPASYPSLSTPGLISATGPSKCDLRAEVNQILASQQAGEPCLDAIIAEFVALIEKLATEAHTTGSPSSTARGSDQSKTTIIWLHHLLATSKRKQALWPQVLGASEISGITKPGYPGVMIFSGPSNDIDEHVHTLKQLRWQGFQVRCETEGRWSFKHGRGIVEVESMAEVVNDLEEVREQRNIFMEAMKMQ